MAASPARPASTRPDAPTRPDGRRSLLWTAVMLGVGAVVTLDQVVLHQLLQWHTLYVSTTPFWRTFVDGLLHLAAAGLLLWGALRLWAIRAQPGVWGANRVLWAGILLGMGGFNLYDGTVQHKLLGLHPVREGVEGLAILPYDLAFNGAALLLLASGWLLLRRARCPA